MLKREPGALDLARVGLAAQLLDQLGALRKAGGTQRVPLREKPPRGIGDVLSAIGIVAIIDELPGLAVPAEAEGLVGDELVLGKAVVQFHHVQVFGPDACRLVNLGADNLTIFEKIDLPVASTQFKILDAKNLGVARAGVSFLETLAWILPILMILCFVGSALLARDRRRATIRAGVAVAMTAGAILVILNIGRTLFVDLMIGNSLSVDAGTALYDTVLRFVKASLLAVGVIGLIVAISAWLTGPAGPAVRVRGALKSGISGLRDQAESSGWKPGPVAQYVADHLKILRWAVISAAFVLLLLVGRTSVGSVLLLVVLALIALGVLEFMGRATSRKDPSDEKSEKTPETSSN